jgi:hypothetical protein
LVATVAALDLDELEVGLAVKRELLQVESAISSKRDLSEEDPDRLGLAVGLTRCGAPAVFLDKTPAEAYALAADTIGRLSSLANTIEGCLPILQALGLDRAFSSRGLDAVAVSALTASEIVPRHRSWVATPVDIDEITFEKAYSSWSDLAAADYDWRQKLKAYGRTPWPPAVSIEAAASVFRKRFLAKAFASLTGSSRAARELALQLG